MDESPDGDLATLAASITAAVLQFDIERLPRNPVALPYDAPGKLGELAFIFLPDQHLVAANALAGHVAGLPKPVLLAALATKGYIAAWWRDGLSARAIAAWDHNVANGQKGLARQFAELDIADSDLVLVETTQVRFYVPAPALRYWLQSYRIDILWNLVPLTGDARARARLLLGRGDGSSSPGGGCATPGQVPPAT